MMIDDNESRFYLFLHDLWMFLESFLFKTHTLLQKPSVYVSESGLHTLPVSHAWCIWICWLAGEHVVDLNRTGLAYCQHIHVALTLNECDDM